jgi:hydrogenase nickel incorporation protein HypA/HybF
MHELAITQRVVEMVAERTAGRPVSLVRLEVGGLSGVVPDAMEFCYELLIGGTPLEGSTLVIERTPGAARCRSCGQDFAIDDLILLCRCGSAEVELIAGRELKVLSVELVAEPCA